MFWKTTTNSSQSGSYSSFKDQSGKKSCGCGSKKHGNGGNGSGNGGNGGFDCDCCCVPGIYETLQALVNTGTTVVLGFAGGIGTGVGSVRGTLSNLTCDTVRVTQTGQSGRYDIVSLCSIAVIQVGSQGGDGDEG